MTASKASYPSMPQTSWWALRERLTQSNPPQVTTSYLATVLGITEDSARNNVLPALRSTRLVDDNGTFTDRAMDWRDDSQYPKACKEILDDVYPDELKSLFNDPDSIDQEQLIGWFQRNARVGRSAAYKMARFYSLLLEADYSKKSEGRTRKQSTSTRKGNTSGSSPSVREREAQSSSRDHDRVPQVEGTHQFPSPELHVDIQIHISPEAGTDQIDQIFASMGKHLKSLYRSGEQDDT